MPGLIDQLRKRFPELASYSDEEIANAAAPTLGGLDQAASYLGIERNEPGFGSSFRSGLATYPIGVGRALEDAGATGLGQSMRRYGEDVQFRNPSTVHDFESFAAAPWQGVKQITGRALGTTLPGLVPYVGPIGRGLGAVGAGVAGAGIAALPSFGQIRAQQIQTGQENIPLAVGGSLAIGGIEQLGGVQRMFRPGQTGRALGGIATRQELGEMASTPLRTFGLQAGRVSGGEALEELAQGPIEQYAGGQNPMEHLGETAFGGFSGAIGGLLPFGLGSGARRAFQQRSINRFADSNYRNTDAELQEQLDAAEVQRHFIAQAEGQQVADQWYDSTLNEIATQHYQGINNALAGGSAVDLLSGRVHNPAVPMQDWINQQLGVGLKPQPRRDAQVAFKHELDVPAWITDDQGNPVLAKTDFELYDYNNRQPPLSPEPYQPLPAAQPFAATPVQGQALPQDGQVDQMALARDVLRHAMMNPPQPGSQFERDARWAEQFLQSQLTPAQYKDLRMQLTGVEATPKTAAPAAPATQQAKLTPGGELLRAAGIKHTEKRVELADKLYDLAQRGVITQDDLDTNVGLLGEYKNFQNVEKYATNMQKAAIQGQTAAPATPPAVASPAAPAPKVATAPIGVPAEQLGFQQGAQPNVNSRQVVRQGQGQQQGAQPVQQVQAQATAGVSAAPAADTKEQQQGAIVPLSTDVLAEQSATKVRAVLEQVANKMRSFRKAEAFAMSQGFTDGHSYNNQEIADHFGVTREAVRKWLQDVEGRLVDAVYTYNRNNPNDKITAQDFRGPSEVVDDDQRVALDARQASFARGDNATAADLVETQQGEDADSGGRNTGYSVKPISQINSSNIVGEAKVSGDGKVIGGVKPAGDAEANRIADDFEEAQKTGDYVRQAGDVWDAYAHISAAGGEQVKTWEALEETPTGQQTKQDWIQFFKKSLDSPKPDRVQMARLRKILKDKYFKTRTLEQIEREWGDLRPMRPDAFPALLTSLQRRFMDGHGALIKQRLAGIYSTRMPVDSKGSPTTDAFVMWDPEDNGYVLVLGEHLADDPQFIAEWAIHHELSHVIDHAELRTGLYSDNPTLREFGAVRRQIMASMHDHQVEALFSYPLKTAPRDAPNAVTKELYAQIMGAYYVPRLQTVLKQKLPLVYQFAEENHEEVTRISRAVEGVAAQIQPAATAREPRTADGQVPTREDEAGVRGQRYDHPAYHGSPHIFDRFTTQKIGTGEGAQAYGWGMYFAGSKDVAKWYREKLTPAVTGRGEFTLVLSGIPSSLNARVSGQVDALLSHDVSMGRLGPISKGQRVKTQVIENLQRRKLFADVAIIEGLIDEIEAVPASAFSIAKVHKQGRLYQVELAPKEDEYLEWDKPFSEQSEKVKAALKSVPALAYTLDPGASSTQQRFIDETTGSRLYSTLATELSDHLAGRKGVGHEAASKALLAAGIPGIKYLDGSSRNATTPTVNDIPELQKLLGPIYYESITQLSDNAPPQFGWKQGRITPVSKVKVRPSGIAIQVLDADGNYTYMHVDQLSQSNDMLASDDALFTDEETLDLVFKIKQFKPNRTENYNYVIFDDSLVEITAYESRGSAAIEAAFRETQNKTFTGITDLWARFKPSLLTLHQLADQFAGKLTSLRKYVESMDEMEQRQVEITQRGHAVVLEWQQLHGQTKRALDQVMLRATMEGIHPDKALGHPDNAHVRDQAAYNALKRSYDALPADAKKVYQAARDLLADNWAARKQAFDKTTRAAYQKLIDAAAPSEVAKLTAERDKHIRDHDKMMGELRGPYFPLLRFGQYLAIGRSPLLKQLQEQLETATGPEHTRISKRIEALKQDKQHYVVQAFESRHAAERAAGSYKARGLDAHAQLAEKHFRALQPVAAGSVERISSVLASQFDKAVAGKMKHLLTDLYISTLPEHAALQRELKRIGVEGANEDMLRSVARSVEKDAFHIARMEYADEMADNLFKLKQEAKKAGVDHQHVYNELASRVALDFEWKETPIQSALVRMSAVWHLGMSPAYLLTNMSQPWMITAPVLAGRFGLGKSLGALRSAFVDAAGVIKQSKKGGMFADLDMNAVADPAERAMLQYVMNRGQIDITQNVDMGLVADGVDPRMLKTQKIINWANHHVEAANRITTALAAFRLAREQGMANDAAREYAFKQVVDTQLNYANANAAYWMKNNAFAGSKLIMQFRKYQQGMLYLLARNAQLAFKGDRDALRTLGYLGMTQALFAGAVGIPVVTAPLAVVGMFMGDDDEDGDPETQVRNWLADQMGPEAARVFWKGLPTLLGVDVSKRVGMGDIWNPLPFARVTGKTGEEDTAQLVYSALGAPIGMLGRMVDGAQMMEKGQWQKGAEKMLPKVLADLSRGARIGREGMTSRSGETLVPSDRIDGWDVVYRAAGFSPVVESEHYAAQSSKLKVSNAIDERRKSLIAAYAQAVLRGDEADMDDIESFNEDHPDKGYRIDRSSLIKAVQARKRGAKELDGSGVRFNKRERSLQDIDRYAQ